MPNPKVNEYLNHSSPEELQTSEIRYRRLFEAARDGILILDAGTRKITDVNPYMTELLGYKPEEFLGKELWQIGLLKDEEANIAAFRELQKNNYIRYDDLPLKTKDGEIREVEFVSNIYLENGRQVVQCNIRDITERKYFEEVLRQSESRLANAQRIAHIGSWDADLQNNHLHWSEEVYRIFGLDKDQFKGTYEAFLNAVHPEDRQMVKSAGTAALSQNAPYNIEHRIIRLDGEERFVREIGEVTFDESGNPLHFVGTVQDITERKRAQAALKSSEARFNQLVESEIIGIITTNLNGSIIEANDIFLKTVGYSRNELLAGKLRWDEMTPPELLWQDELARKQLTDFGYSRPREKEYIRKDGSRVAVLIGGTLLKGTENTVIAFVLDISERKQMDVALRESEIRLRTIVETEPECVKILGLKGELLEMNPAGLAIIEADSIEQVRGAAVIKIVAPEHRRAFAKLTRDVLGGGSIILEFEIIGLKGTRRWLETHAVPMSNKDGKIISLLGVTRDITERKKAVEDLREQKQLLQQIFDHLPVMISFFGNDGLIKLINKESERVQGWTLAEIIGQNLDLLVESYPNQKDHQKAQDAITAATGEWTEFKITSKSGQVIDTAWAYVKLSDGTNVGIGQDITERKLGEKSLRESEQKLLQAQKLESVGMLAGGIAHDFNNMLTAINGYSDLTLRRLKIDDPLRDNIVQIKKAGLRSASLTQQLLAFSRQQVLHPVVTNLNEVIADTIKMLQRVIGENIQLTTTLNPKIGRALIDPGQFSQIIMNLAINARDAMPQGGRLTIETTNVYLDSVYAKQNSSFIPGGYVLLAISDNGTGMNNETKKHLFEPFFTTKEVGQGTGLGLATVYGIVKQSGGNIEVYSELGIGTTFKIYLPRVAEPVQATAINNISSEIPKGMETILLVEDEDLVRNLSQEILKTCGYMVVEARNGVEALKIFDNEDYKFDLLMTDIVMPEMGGRVLAEKLKEKVPNLKILFTSGYTNDAVVRDRVIETNTNFIQKPFTLDALAGKIREILDNPDKT